MRTVGPEGLLRETAGRRVLFFGTRILLRQKQERKYLSQEILFPGRRRVEPGWRGEGAPRPRRAAWPRARPGKSRDRTLPQTGLTPEKESLTYSSRL